jgi:hypothetical protein
MKFSLLYRPNSSSGISPYRVVDEQNREIPWLNEFLDAQRARGLSLCSVRAYAYDLLHFARWWFPISTPPCSTYNCLPRMSGLAPQPGTRNAAPHQPQPPRLSDVCSPSPR